MALRHGDDADFSARKVRPDVALKLPTGIILPKPGETNVLVTSALPYVNNIPHLGNIIGSVLSADVYARYCRARHHNVLYICGTDEYGTATETQALKEGVSCQELCDKYHRLHANVYKHFDISFDYFGRTTTPQQTEIAQDIFHKLNDRHLFSENSMVQPYCQTCQRFLADRYVEGTCPKCGYEDARGDQCDKCGVLINAVELIEPRCKICGSTPTLRESTHLFLDLPTLQPRCEQFVERSSAGGKWSSNGKVITASWLKDGLKPRCITRDLKWGTPVPYPGMEDKVFYVWFDAPIGYLSITANYTADWEKWWKNPENVKLYQFMGKDNVPFHTVIFPSSLIGTEDPYTLLHHINTAEYLNYEGDKFSKSRNIGVFGSSVVETGIPASVWRYYLLTNRPETNDSMFTWKDFIARNNNELLANVGNLCNRVIKFVDSAKYAGVVPDAHAQATDHEHSLVTDVNHLVEQYNAQLGDQVKLRAGLKLAMDVSARGNRYLQDCKITNTLFTEHRARCDTVVATSLNLIYLLSALLYPYMPAASEGICRQLNAPLRSIPDGFSVDDLQPGHVIGKPEHLFKRIDPAMEEKFKQQFGGGASK